MKLCYLLFPQYSSFEPLDKEGCIEPDGHPGPHKFITEDGKICEWNYDDTCTCGCMDEDSDGQCIIYAIK